MKHIMYRTAIEYQSIPWLEVDILLLRHRISLINKQKQNKPTQTKSNEIQYNSHENQTT
jgi:hypothetical protein